MAIGNKSIPFKFFLTFRIVFASFRLENLTVNLFGPLLANQWQSSMLDNSISIFSFSNNWRGVSSSYEFLIYWGKPLSSKHSRLYY